MPLANIGVTDFRAFKGNVHFEFAPITVITGTNSSGKSTLMDAIRIMEKYFSRAIEGVNQKHEDWTAAGKLLIDDLIPRIPSFKSLVNHQNDAKDKFAIHFRTHLLNIDDEFELTIEFCINDEQSQNGHVSAIEIFSIGKQTNVFVLLEHPDGQQMDVNFPYFLDAFEKEVKRQIEFYSGLEGCYLPKEHTVGRTVNGELNFGTELYEALDEALFSALKPFHPQLFSKLENNLRDSNPWGIGTIWPDISKHETFNSFVNIEFNKALYKGYFEDKSGLDFNRIEILKRFIDNTIPFWNYKTPGEEDAQEREKFQISYNELITNEEFLNQSQGEIMAKLEREWLENVVFELSKDNSSVTFVRDFLFVLNDPLNHVMKPSGNIKYIFRTLREIERSNHQLYFSLCTLFHTNGEFDFANMTSANVFTDKGEAFLQKTVFSQISRLFMLIADDLKHQYIPSIRTIPQRFFTSSKASFIDEVISKFLEQNPLRYEMVANFCKKQLCRLGIGEDIQIEYSEELGIKTISILRAGEKINLLDLGFGILQFVPLLLQTCITAAKTLKWGGNPEDPDLYVSYSSMMLVEEPETNLHPALQSKLADMFIEASREFKIQFIIESHSEYLIRKLQYLTAKGEIEPDKTQIYYFNNPNDNPKAEEQVKKINIGEDGSLTDDFGIGFFDEADRIAIDLYNLTKSRHN